MKKWMSAVLADIDIHYLTPGPLYIIFGAAAPSSGDGTSPLIMLEDYSLLSPRSRRRDFVGRAQVPFQMIPATIPMRKSPEFAERFCLCIGKHTHVRVFRHEKPNRRKGPWRASEFCAQPASPSCISQR